jgi:uncharacterized membrane protein
MIRISASSCISLAINIVMVVALCVAIIFAEEKSGSRFLLFGLLVSPFLLVLYLHALPRALKFARIISVVNAAWAMLFCLGVFLGGASSYQIYALLVIGTLLWNAAFAWKKAKWQSRSDSERNPVENRRG